MPGSIDNPSILSRSPTCLTVLQIQFYQLIEDMGQILMN